MKNYIVGHSCNVCNATQKNKKIIACNVEKYQTDLIFFCVACNDFFIFFFVTASFRHDCIVGQSLKHVMQFFFLFKWTTSKTVFPTFFLQYLNIALHAQEQNCTVSAYFKATRCEFSHAHATQFVELNKPEIVPCSHHLINTRSFSK